MQSISVAAPSPSSSSYPIPNRHLHFHNHLRPLHRHHHHHHHHNLINTKAKNFLALTFSKSRTHIPETFALDLSTTTSCSNQHDKLSDFSYPVHDFALYQQFYSSVGANGPAEQNPDPQNRREREEELFLESGAVSENMWWGDLKSAVGQRFNVEGIVSSAAVVLGDRHLLIPHVSVQDIRCIDWVELHRRGFKGVVFDKDNTITAPYSLTLWGPLGDSIDRCKSVFGEDIVVFSNSAGLFEYDPNGSKARQLEAAIGIKVLRHRVKKPAGSTEEVEEHFGCDSSQLIIVGDRLFTDIVYGNRNGCLTILTEPLSLKEEPFIVRQVRKLETSLLKHWIGRGRKPTSHSLLPDALHCVKDHHPLQ